jgi:mono/diheme cytochrome c family protein/glucose/arabinose dehydrogenase
MWCRTFLIGIVINLSVQTQEGDKAGEEQRSQVPRELIPPAPPLSPDEALKTFRLQPGFRIELVASEPMIEAPICIQFDPDGRLWVLEMRGYMPDADGKGESEPKGRVSVLEDTNGDGHMDKSTVFLDGLVMPRAMILVQDGLLLAEPPKLWFCRDTNGDGKCDAKEEVASDYAVQADPKFGPRANHEHTANGLMRGLDNWIYSANHTVRFRNTDGFWRREATSFRGQWGIAQDDYGRLFYNSNEDPLRADFVPSAYLARNLNYLNPAGANAQLYDDKAVWPVRVNPGVNRGYRKGQLRPDGTLATFTAACAPLVYRGDNFPADARGNVFVCDPAGNLIKRYVLEDHGVSFKAKNAYDKAEFLASTDERFRPVNLANAPDGCLYIVDMYHGVIQHHLYVTTYLRNQIMDRGLEKPTNLGRIYRVVHESKQPGPKPGMAKATSPELVNFLSKANGWWRDTAQRLLIERNDSAAVTTVKRVATSGPNLLGRLHALWVLEGLRQIDSVTLKAALADAHPKVRAAAIRLTESLLKNQPELFSEILKHIGDSEPDVQLQLALTLGEVRDARAEEAMARIARQNTANLYIRDALITGLGGRELEFLERLLVDKEGNAKNPGSGEFLGALAGCVFAEAIRDRVNRLFELAAKRPQEIAWQRLALLNGIINTAPRAPKGRLAPKIKPVRLIAEPPALIALGKMQDKEIQELVKTVTTLVTWPGKPGAEPEMAVKPLTAEQQKQFEQGKELFLLSCGACHQPHGKGQEGLAPPLVDSEWVAGPPTRLVRMVLNGVRGPINVQGRTYELDMPSLGVFEDEQIAAILTYIRREWGHTYDPVEPEPVKKIRAETEKREEAWTELELLKIP